MISDVKVRELVNYSDPIFGKYKHLVPDVLFDQSIEFKIKGVNAQIANALRRAAMLEIPGRALEFEHEEFSSTDPFLLIEMIQVRVGLIPILQNTAIGATFALHAENTGPVVREVLTSEIKPTGGRGKLPFNGNMILCDLQPGCTLRINNIHVTEGFGHQNAKYAVGLNGASVALDQEPFNPFTGRGVPSSVSSPKEFLIRLNNNGGIKPTEMMRVAASSISERLRRVLTYLPQVQTTGDMHVLVVPDESDTIATLLVREIAGMGDASATYTSPDYQRSLTLTVVTSDGIAPLIEEVVRRLTAVFDSIASEFAAIKQ